MFAKHQLNLVVTVGGPAAAFATKHRQTLFPETPLLLAAVDERYVKNTTLTANDAVVAVRNDVQGVIENIRHVLPLTRTIFLVIGNSPHEQFWRKQIDGELQRFRSQLQFVWLNDLSFQEMLKRCASLRRTQQSSTFYFPSIRKAHPEPRAFHCRDFTLKQARRSLAFIEASWGMESLVVHSCRWMTWVR